MYITTAFDFNHKPILPIWYTLFSPLNTKMAQLSLHKFVFLVICLPFLCLSLETDTLSSGLALKDPDAIISPQRYFKLGFFSPNSTTNRYLAVFYAFSENSPIWIANRDNPLTDSSSTVTISQDGNLALINARNQSVWSTNATTSPINTTLQIQDTGNLVLRNNATGTIIWESFSEPLNVFVPNMKLSHNTVTGKKVLLSSWKNATNPEAGSFTYGLEAVNGPQLFLWNNGRPRWRSGLWNGTMFMGVQDMYFPYLRGFNEVYNDSGGTYYFTSPEWNVSRKIFLNSSGSSWLMTWDEQKKEWHQARSQPDIECDNYGLCGPFGSCNPKDLPICSCMRGFEPNNKEEWDRGNWSSGCKRKNQLQCGSGRNGDRFFRVQYMKIPDLGQRFSSWQEDECRTRCYGNCSCIAYAHEPKIGCLLWNGSLIDNQIFDGVGLDLFLRLSASEFDNHNNKRLRILIAVVVAFASMSMLVFVAWCWMVKRKEGNAGENRIFETRETFSSDSTPIVVRDETEKVYIGESPLFTFEMLADATDQFHDTNLLGRGGFGAVYKGTLADGKEIAVKRLSAASKQGMEEFMNEVILISKLQHRNLVRLLGCCVEKEEKMLIYEYMPNKSLDICLFDPSHPSRKILDWQTRFSIIEGIGRGLLYLHRDSRLKIIHRDLKPSNVLLDEDWNPRISDFGMARIFGGNQDYGNTIRVVGTYGYMAPEYAMEGRFSEKSDVYSFGVLMLEILKGEKNTHYYNHERSLSLLGCAWKMWSEDNGLGFADESITSVNFKAEIVRCIQIGLLCVQELPKDRPSIQTVLSMLSHEIVELPMPEEPIFDQNWEGFTTGQTQPTTKDGYSLNQFSVTELHGR